MKYNATRFACMSILLALFGACMPLQGSRAKQSITLDEWVAKHITANERLLCERDVNREYFFIARIGDRVKVGSRVDITGTSRTPKTLISGWLFQNEKDSYLATNTPPTTVKGGYTKDGDRIYAEQIEYQTLYIQGSQKMRVAINIKKCPTENCSREKTASKEEEQYRIEVCEVSLDKQ